MDIKYVTVVCGEQIVLQVKYAAAVVSAVADGISAINTCYSAAAADAVVSLFPKHLSDEYHKLSSTHLLLDTTHSEYNSFVSRLSRLSTGSLL